MKDHSYWTAVHDEYLGTWSPLLVGGVDPDAEPLEEIWFETKTECLTFIRETLGPRCRRY